MCFKVSLREDYEKCGQNFGWDAGRKRPLGRPRRRWEDNIKINLMEMGWMIVEWIYVDMDRDKWRDFVNTVINLCN
jgi:hypothetical protein